MLDDVYALARECVSALRDAGHDAAAEQLDRALCGATSGEILGDLALASKSIVATTAPLSPDVQDRLKRLRADAQAALRPRWR